ncbi:MAG: NADH-quinone oxidoreductase subunit NuoK [Phycisphaerales bacterium]|nr:NADH-quinone oxidoreductase subunit NuoK [Deltaproteobacteria bacterium]
MPALFSLQSYLLLSAMLFVIGLIIVLTKNNAIQIIMGIELIFNAAAINFVAFSCFRPHLLDTLQMSGQVIAIFVIVVAAADACAALAIILSLFRVFKTTRIQNINRLKG